MPEQTLPGGMPQHAIAIVGMAGRFPGADSLEAFWQGLRDGVESLATFSDAELDEAGVPVALRAHAGYVRRGTVLEDADAFDASFFGISPREAQAIDPQQRIFLECAWEAMEHAGYGAGASTASVGVYAGASMNTYLFAQMMRNPAVAQAIGAYQLMLGNDKDYLCTRVSYKLDLHGPSMTIQTACSTSLVAVEVACRALQRGECDMALAGGVSVNFPQRSGYLYQEGMILSPDGHCRPFDADARGTRAGAGAGIVVLKRLDDALADGDSIHAVIRGIAVNNDGAGKAGYTAPSVDGQIEVIATAQALAGVTPRSIGYIEAHGTATPLGDPIEIAALTQVFRASTADVGFCRLGALKANIGHLDAAAGVAGLIKTVLVLKHREIPPLVNFKHPNPQLELTRSPFIASASVSAWPTTGAQPRRAGVSSFGIGGTNAHAVLEEAPAPTPRADEGPRLLVVSARTPEALERATQRLADHLEANPDIALADAAWTLQAGRREFAHRRALVASDRAEAVGALRQPRQAPVVSGVHEGGARPVAFLFSGQGSQHPGMGAALYRHAAVFRDAVDRCAEILRPHLDEDVRTVMFERDGAHALEQTRLTQPALFVIEYALAMLWRQRGVAPRAMLGHSLGEYVAAHLAGVMSLDDALAVVAARGRLMQSLPAGRMAAVHASAEVIGSRLRPGVEIAAINAPGLCTVSGPAPMIDDLVALLKAQGIDTRPLQTSHAFHSAMMDPVLPQFTDVLRGVRLSAPTIPYVSNVSGTWITDAQATSPAYYAEHLRRTVRFEPGLRMLAADAALHFIEVGPGQTLTALARQSLGADGARRVVASLPHARDERGADHAMLEAAGRLWLAGVPLDARALHGVGRLRVPLPTYPFERQRHWVDAVAPGLAVAADDTAPRVSTRVDDWSFAPTWARDDAAAPRVQSLSGCWLVLGQADALTDKLMQALADAGAKPMLVLHGDHFERTGPSRYTARRSDVADFEAVLQEGRTRMSSIGGVVHLWALDPSQAQPPHAAYDTLVALSVALAPVADAASPVMVLHATAGATGVLEEAQHDPAAALALGAVLVLPAEIPGLTMRSVDLDPGRGSDFASIAAHALLDEAARTTIEPEVARRHGRRWLRRHERIALPEASDEDGPLKRRGRYLITGGLGGMGLTLAHWLAQRFEARLLLTARTPLPPREIWDEWLASHPPDERHAQAIDAIRAMEQSGAEVLVAAADAADEASMAAAIAMARQRFGGLDGIIHAAGVPGAGTIAMRKQPGDSVPTIAPKLQGLDVLVRLLGGESLDIVALMSSINAVLGAAGASDYAAANLVLDRFAESASWPQGWRLVIAIDWGAWRDVGMAAKLEVPPAMRAQWQAHLARAIAPALGVQAFARALASGRRRVVIVSYDLVRAHEIARLGVAATSHEGAERKAHRAAHASDSAAGATARAAAAGPGVAAGSNVERQVAEIWTELLGVEAVGADDDFFELGGHSLLATRVLARIGEAFGVRLALRDVFEAPTVARLAQRIASASSSAVPAAATRPTPHDDGEREEVEF